MSTVATMGKDMRTRWPGVYVRHQKACRARAREGARCNCRAGYIARVYDRGTRSYVISPTLRTGAAAAAWRLDTLGRLDRGELPEVRTTLRLGQAAERFVEAAREGRALTKHGRRYKRSAVDDLDGALQVHVIPALGRKRLTDVRRGDVQQLIDDIAPKLSGSRVRTVVNALRSLYRWAQERDLAANDPAARVRLPAMDATPRERVATPRELAGLLDLLEETDRLVYALAAYATARAQEIRALRWDDVDLELGTVRLGGDPDARKAIASLRLVPLVKPIWALLRAEYLRQGRPAGAARVCPPRYHAASGELSTSGVQRRARAAWGWTWAPGRAGKPGLWVAGPDALAPIGLHECRHTAASWMNAAGVNPKVASLLMGHSTPERAAAAAFGAAALTLARYTHTLPGDLEAAREQLDRYLARELAAGQRTGS